MLCQQCKKQTATVHLTDLVQGEKRERHLCEDCANSEGVVVKQNVSINDVLNSFLMSQASVQEMARVKCPDCGITFVEFRNQGLLGCADDYEVFGRALTGVIERAQDGQSSAHRQETGRDGQDRPGPAGTVPAPAGTARGRRTGGLRAGRQDSRSVGGTAITMTIEDLLHSPGEWLKTGGNLGDVVVSSRIRLARNLSGFRFLTKASPAERRDIARTLSEAIASTDFGRETFYIDVEKADPLDRQFLVERQLISRQHGEAEGSRGVAIAANEQLSLMINEEDHLRMQVLRHGMDLDDAWNEIATVDAALETMVKFAYHEQYGYLTACPTNVGTGLRVSVMLHLPALKITNEIEKVLRAAKDMRLAVRGLYGEGTEALGDFFQVSNQVTLGRSEEEILTDFREQRHSLDRPLRAGNPQGPQEGQAHRPRRQDLAGVRHPVQRPGHQQRGNAVPPLAPADGRGHGADQAPRPRRDQRSVPVHAVGPSAEALRQEARRRSSAASSAPTTSANALPRPIRARTEMSCWLLALSF